MESRINSKIHSSINTNETNENEILFADLFKITKKEKSEKNCKTEKIFKKNKLSVKTVIKFEILTNYVSKVTVSDDEKFIYGLEKNYIVDLSYHKSNMRSIEFNCEVCFYFLIKPLECSNCEKRICKKCYNNMVLSKKNSCPFCNKKLKFKNASLLFRNIMAMFNISCPKMCGSIIAYENYEKHLKECKGFVEYKMKMRELEWLIKSMHKEKEDFDDKYLELEEKLKISQDKKIKYKQIISELVRENESLKRNISDKNFEIRKLKSKFREEKYFIVWIFKVFIIFIIYEVFNEKWN